MHTDPGQLRNPTKSYWDYGSSTSGTCSAANRKLCSCISPFPQKDNLSKKWSRAQDAKRHSRHCVGGGLTQGPTWLRAIGKILITYKIFMALSSPFFGLRSSNMILGLCYTVWRVLVSRSAKSELNRSRKSTLWQHHIVCSIWKWNFQHISKSLT